MKFAFSCVICTLELIEQQKLYSMKWLTECKVFRPWFINVISERKWYEVFGRDRAKLYLVCFGCANVIFEQ